MKIKNLFLSYILGAAGLFSPFAGLHRFYLGKRVSGVVYLCTWGFLGIGTVLDLIRMPTLVDATNYKVLTAGHGNTMLLPDHDAGSFTTAEREILRIAQRNRGAVTPQMVTMNTLLSLQNAKDELDRLFRAGFCTTDVNEDGTQIYVFNGL